MRASLVLLAACSFSAELPEPPPEQTTTVVDESFDGAIVDGTAGDAIEPDGFVLFGLHARAYQTELVDNGESFAKVLADAAMATQTGEGYAQVPANWTNQRPRGLGLALNDTFSVIYDGEILLPKGMVTLEADVDARALIETMGVTLYADGIDSTSFTVPEAGWYPIRTAFSDGSGNARFTLTLVQGQVRIPVEGNRLRARVTNARGLVVFAFEDPGFVTPRGHTARPTIDEDFSVGPPPYDLITGPDDFTLRFAGQLRIDAAGMYEFSALADDGFRIWIDGELVAHRWLGHVPDVLSAQVMLSAGWHSIVVDYGEEAIGASIEVRMNGAVLDPAKLRPVVVRGNTFTFADIVTPVPIKDTDSTFLMMPLPGDASTLIDTVDYGFRIENQDMSQLQITLFDCRNNGVPLMGNPAPSYHYYPDDRGCAAKPTKPAIPWQIRITDTVAGNGLNVGPGQVRDYGLTAMYRGGPNMPFAPVVTYTSPPKATPMGALRIAAIRAIGALDGATVDVAVRSAPDEASLATAPYVELRENAVETSAFAQYRITLGTNGWISPRVDRVEIDYVVEGE